MTSDQESYGIPSIGSPNAQEIWPAPPGSDIRNEDMRSVSGARSPMRSVLVIEDDPAMAQAIADVFSDAGYHPVSVRTLGEGRASLIDDRPELVVLDLTLETEFGAG